MGAAEVPWFGGDSHRGWGTGAEEDDINQLLSPSSAIKPPPVPSHVL